MAGCSEQQQEEHGRVEESTRQNLVMAFSNVVRTSALAGVVDLQRASMGFGALLEREDDATEFDLGALHTFLVEQGGPLEAVDEVCVFLKSREGRFGLVMHLPPHLAELDESARETMVQAFATRGAVAATRAGRTPVSSTVSSPQQTGTTPKSGTWEPPKPAKSNANTLLKAFAVVVVLGVVNAVYLAVDVGPESHALAITEPAGVPCVRATVNSGTVFCFVDAAYIKSTPAAVLSTKAGITRAWVRSKGHTRLLVLNAASNKVVLSL